MNRRDDKNYMEHCADQRCERLECENLYLRNQLEQLLKEIRQPNPSATNFIQQKINSVTSNSDRLFNSANNSTLPRQRHISQCQKCSLDEVGSQCSSGSQTAYPMAASTPTQCRHQEQHHHLHQTQPPQQQQQPRQPQNSNVVSRRLRLIEEELAAFKQDLSTMLHQPTRHADEKSTTEMASYSGWYSDRCATSSVGNIPLKFDQQVQTSPSDTPSHWPPPSVHGSPRRKPTSLVKLPRDVPSPAIAPRSRSHPVKTDLLKWALSRPGCRLAKARYSYKPLRDSPNNYPELELSLEPGDYLLLLGNLDDDYFYHGELFNGQQGLVPSNYVEIIEDDGRQDSMNQNLRQDRLDSDLMANHFLQHNGADFTNKSFLIQPDSTTRSSTLPETGCPYPSGDVCGVTVHEARQLDGGARVPSPREISVERQLTKSILISWSPPYNAITSVAHYHVCVNGVVRAVVPGGYKTKALIENVDINKATRVSVRTVTEMGHSADAACTVTIGKTGVNVAAQELKVSNVTPNSVNVSWYPSNSNIEHMVLLNGLKIGTCPPGVYQVQLKGLLNSTMYRCTVRVKDPKAVLEEKPLETHIDFKTLPRVGLPDPPQNVQCEFGPQDGTILVTWQPIINGSQSHSKYGVAGYLVYADGKLVTEINSPTGDHAILHWSTLSIEPPLFVSVKTKARDGALSADSETVRVPRAIGNVRSRTMEGLKMPSTTLPSSTMTSATSYYNVMNPNPAPLTVGLSQSGQSLIGNYTNFQQNLQQNTNTSGYVQQMYNPTAIIPQLGGGGITTLSSSANAMIPGVQYPAMASVCSYPANTMMAPNALTASLIRPNQSNLDSSATSYYVFHPRLTQVDSSCLEKPSLLEMETNYLVRHQRRQQRSQAFGNRRSYSLNDEDHYQQISSIPHTNSLLLDKRQYAIVPVNRQSGGARAYDIATVAYSDDDWNYPRVAPSQSIEKPLIARYRRKLRQVDSRAFSEPDLRTDPRLMALRPKGRPRYVVAIYDYNPSHMSPNPNGAQEELSFRKGQTILIYGDKDSDGFYHGELNGRSGLVPSNLVLETESDQQRILRRSDVSPSYSDVPSYPTYSKRLPQPSAFARSDIATHPIDPYYAPRKHFIGSDLDRWGHNASDPSLSRSRHLDYDSPPIPTSVERERYNVGVASAAVSAHGADSRSRRMKFQQKSHSLDYDIERDEFVEREAAYQRRAEGMPRDGRSSHSVHAQHFATSDRDRTYPRHDDYFPRYRRDIDDERRLPRDAAGEYYGSLPRLPYRSREEYGVAGGHRDDAQDSNYDGHRYAESSYSPRQQRLPGRYSDASPGAYGGDTDTSHGSMRRLPQNRETEREGRRRGSFRRGGRDALEQTIIETVRGAPPRRFLAKFDYDPKENSPNPGAELDELNFRAGDAITVYGEMDDDGFFIGELNGRRGLVPSNFLTFDTPSKPPEPQQTQQAAPIPADENFESVVPASVVKSRKDGVSFSADTRSVDSNGPVAPSKQVSPKTTPKGAAGTKPAGKTTGTLKKADSTTSNKAPTKKVSTASAPGAVKKPAAAAAAGKPAAAPTAKKK